MPELDFSVAGAEAVTFAAQPTLALKLRIDAHDGAAIRAVSLAVQVRIAAPQRAYSSVEQERLRDLFGEPARWGQTLKSLLWTIATVQVPAFEGQTMVDLTIPCSYDFEVLSTRYFDALQNGLVPLELLFSGTIFYAGEHGLQIEHIGWDKEARFGLPVQVWQDAIRQHFPNSAWLRVHKETFDRLNRYRRERTLPTWEATLDRLLDAAEHQEPSWTR